LPWTRSSNVIALLTFSGQTVKRWTFDKQVPGNWLQIGELRISNQGMTSMEIR
jgi:hypothetical protein